MAKGTFLIVDPETKEVVNETNRIHWKIGDCVVHRADAKNENMLMQVTAIQKNGRYVTRYIHSRHLPGMDRKKWRNDIESLLDPSFFGILIPGKEASQ